ncbi:zinc finger A20 and AN1 domain-containing stress-associated protein 6-like [Phalaenopsis equestris]|uniref:zinc finger A20 and AN1 domain-containing stress-associated protein 6-like n=1 Tax=Phalaenopsis equestris TaxID=78828 RepID=UPI0009E4A364|nr:zinc finger A20 and AN1 domain-containing stress-associated protein 6-like [Phalaenopsis equestris]
MAEEQRCQEGHRLCTNNCGLLGSPATMDLCSKCYRDLRLKEEQAASAKIAVEKSLISTSPSLTPSLIATAHVPDSPLSSLPESSGNSVVDRSSATPGRCKECRKRVGLTGFRCRCGLPFCGPHRYPEKHGCSFDYKAAGREAIARANPIVKAAKLHMI